MIAVIADDITGAAEMAGIARRLGLSVIMSMRPVAPAEPCDVLVIATDTRSMSEADAVAETRRVASALIADVKPDIVFKKTDSALRGHVIAELRALLDTTPYSRATYLPANPSKGRIIRDRVYLIDGIPIHETDFSFDPEFPAHESSLSRRFPEAESLGINCPDAVSQADIDRIVTASTPDTLLAGAADLFTSLLTHRFTPGQPVDDNSSLDRRDCIIVCGSTQSDPTFFGLPVSYMPTDLYDGITDPEKWIDELTAGYDYGADSPRSFVLAIRDRHRTGREVAVHLRDTMARVVTALVDRHAPRDLVIEGGATAFSILSRLGWDSLTITREIAPGVIRLKGSGPTFITMKPGSYPWGNSQFFTQKCFV